MLLSVSGSVSTFVIVVQSLGSRSEEWLGASHILNVRNGLGMSEAELLARLTDLQEQPSSPFCLESNKHQHSQQLSWSEDA